MPLCATGCLSLGGSVVDRSVNLELGYPATRSISTAYTKVIQMAQQGGAVCFSCLRGKSEPPPNPGCAYQGGFYMGTISTPANYRLVASPVSCSTNPGFFAGVWKNPASPSGRDPEAESATDGYCNTQRMATSGTKNFQFACWWYNSNACGRSDWYLPSYWELAVISTCGAPPSVASGEGWFRSPTFYTHCYVWASSTQSFGGCNQGQGFTACQAACCLYYGWVAQTNTRPATNALIYSCFMCKLGGQTPIGSRGLRRIPF